MIKEMNNETVEAGHLWMIEDHDFEKEERTGINLSIHISTDNVDKMKSADIKKSLSVLLDLLDGVKDDLSRPLELYTSLSGMIDAGDIEEIEQPDGGYVIKYVGE